MGKFLKLGILGVTPLVILPSLLSWWPQKKQLKIDPSILLVSQAKIDTDSSCEQYSSGAIGEGHQQIFNNSEELLTYLLKNFELSTTETIKIALPSNITPFTFRNSLPQAGKLQSQTAYEYQLNDLQSLENSLKELWRAWSSSWNSPEIEERKIIYTKNRLESETGSSLQSIELYKCYKKMWYGFELTAPPEE